jgi:predicted nuclease with TOPRIM domain
MMIPENIAGYAGTAAGSLLALGYFAQKLITSFKSEKAESSVLSLMHNELERMSDQNSTLSVELGKLQVEVLKLNRELRTLTLENQRLHEEVGRLTEQISNMPRIKK